MHNQTIIELLNKLLIDKKNKKETFKVKAYQKAIKSIKEHNSDITKKEDLDNVKNLSKGSIRSKIEEFLDTGKIQEVDKLNNDVNEIDELTKIYGIGPSKATDLNKNYNIKTVEDLIEKIKIDDTILNDKQKIGLKYYNDLLKRIPRNEMIKHDKFIKDFIQNYIKGLEEKNEKKYELICETVGSFRTESTTSGDIDILCTTNDDNIKLFGEILDNLEKDNYINETLAKGEKKFMGICKLPKHRTYRRIDMIYTSKKFYAFTLLYFTGNADFNVDLRNHALSKGYSLNEYGLTKNGKLIDNNGKIFETEEEILNFLGIKYVEPRDRKGNILHKYLLK